MQTTTETPIQVDVNGQLVQIDNLINALNYIKEEAETRVLSPQAIGAQFQEYLTSDAFFRRVRDYIRNRHIGTISQAVAEEVKAEINSQIEDYILSKIDERVALILQARGL